jgi:hypothetical protein
MEVADDCWQSMEGEEGFGGERRGSKWDPLLTEQGDGGGKGSGWLANSQCLRLGNMFLILGRVGVSSFSGNDLTLIVDDPGRDPDVEIICALTSFASSSRAFGFPLLPESPNPLRVLPPPLLDPVRDPDGGSSSSRRDLHLWVRLRSMTSIMTASSSYSSSVVSS